MSVNSSSSVTQIVPSKVRRISRGSWQKFRSTDFFEWVKKIIKIWNKCVERDKSIDRDVKFIQSFECENEFSGSKLVGCSHTGCYYLPKPTRSHRSFPLMFPLAMFISDKTRLFVTVWQVIPRFVDVSLPRCIFSHLLTTRNIVAKSCNCFSIALRL